MGKPYSEELDGFADTYLWAAQQDVEKLAWFLRRWSGEHAVVVGSGGSYSAAFVIALFRELAHHSPTTATTPLDFLSLVERLSPRVLLLSAEGKNKDILAAARAARGADLATGAVTLADQSPLVQFAHTSGAMRVFPYKMDWEKDGYLATNSLLATVLLLYRVFFGEGSFVDSLGYLFDRSRLSSRRQHLASFPSLLDAKERGVLLIHSSQARTFATDLESKLAEAALAWIQVTDLRQFAHGRHLQLSSESSLPVVVFAYGKSDSALASATVRLLPKSELPFVEIEIDGATEQDAAVSGLIDAMFVTEIVARGSAHDPGQPAVSEFGRAIHLLDPEPLLPLGRPPETRLEAAARRKAGSGVYDSGFHATHIRQAASDYLRRITSARFKSIVCDYDGTLCRAENRFGQMDEELVERMSCLMQSGLVLAVASGRGDSLYQSLRQSFDSKFHSSIIVGYYSGSFISPLSEKFEPPRANPEFRPLHTWLKETVYGHLCHPLDEIARGGQLSIRVSSPIHSKRLRAAIRVWLDLNGKTAWRVYCSGHSVDVLDDQTSKQRVVEHVAERIGLNSKNQMLLLGDCGHEEGNDFELLCKGLSLSCDTVSADLNSCWNFGPCGNNQSDTVMAYLRALELRDGDFTLAETLLLTA